MQRISVYRRLVGYLLPYRRQLFIAYSAIVISTLVSLFIPQIIKDAIDNGVASGEAGALFTAGAAILGISFITGAVAFAQYYFGAWLSHRVGYDLRNDYFRSLQTLPFAFHDRAETGDLMSRATGDVAETERFIGTGIADLMTAVFMIIGVITAMLIENPSLALLGLLPVPVLAVATVRFGGTVRPMFKRIQEQMGVLSSVMQQSMTGIRVVKAFAREGYELGRFDTQNDLWFTRRLRLIRTWANNWPFFTFLVSLSIFLLLWFGGPRALNGEMTVGSLFAMISYILMLAAPVQRLGFLVNLAATAGSSASRVFEIMDTPNPVADRPQAQALDTFRGQVTFEDVTFSYRPGRPVLHGVSFEAQPGQKIALFGPTGAGKSTIINLIPRFYEPDSGVIRLDGIDTRDMTLASLRRHIGVVLQNSLLFSTSIAENIAYGRPGATRDEIVAAAQAAQAHGFIENLPEGYDTQVGERGVTLSGGQKQRIAIARALLTDPRILILDDATSSVDTETEFLIQRTLRQLMVGRTTFIIAQRLLTLKHADCILVVDDGRIVERGTHEALLAAGGLYKRIYDLQLKDQEDVAAVA